MSRRLERWLGIELRHLETFHAVAREQSFSQAAATLGYTQSAVSHQIAALERIVGTRLLDRPGGRKPVTLTEQGVLLLGHADRILTTLSAAEAEMQTSLDGVERLRIGAFQSVGIKVLPALLKHFAAALPSTVIELTEQAWDGDLLQSVANGELDLTFATLPLEDGPFQFVELLDDPLVLLVPANWELAERARPVTLEELASVSIMSFRRCRRLNQLGEEMRSRGLAPHFVYRSDDNSTIQAMVSAGIGAAVLPRLAVDPAYLSNSVAELALPVRPRVIVLAWHQDRALTDGARRFVEIARRLCRTIAQQQQDAQTEPASVAAGR